MTQTSDGGFFKGLFEAFYPVKYNKELVNNGHNPTEQPRRFRFRKPREWMSRGPDPVTVGWGCYFPNWDIAVVVTDCPREFTPSQHDRSLEMPMAFIVPRMRDRTSLETLMRMGYELCWDWESALGEAVEDLEDLTWRRR